MHHVEADYVQGNLNSFNCNYVWIYPNDHSAIFIGIDIVRSHAAVSYWVQGFQSYRANILNCSTIYGNDFVSKHCLDWRYSHSHINIFLLSQLNMIYGPSFMSYEILHLVSPRLHLCIHCHSNKYHIVRPLTPFIFIMRVYKRFLSLNVKGHFNPNLFGQIKFHP